MKVTDQIEKYADEADKPVLRWLFERYHRAHEWNVMATVEHVPDVNAKWGSHMQWRPSAIGQVQYDHNNPPSDVAFSGFPLEQKFKRVFVELLVPDDRDGYAAGLNDLCATRRADVLQWRLISHPL